MIKLIPETFAQTTPVNLGSQYGFGGIGSLGESLEKLVGPGYTIAGIAVAIYFFVGAFKLVISGGDKEAIAGARNMITHAIIGFVLLMMMFLILQMIPQAFGLQGFKLIKI